VISEETIKCGENQSETLRVPCRKNSKLPSQPLRWNQMDGGKLCKTDLELYKYANQIQILFGISKCKLQLFLPCARFFLLLSQCFCTSLNKYLM